MTETFGDWERPGSGASRRAEDLARRDALRRDLDRLRAELARVESAMEEVGMAGAPRPLAVVLAGHTAAALLAGLIGAAGSLLFHVVGSLLVSQHPLQIVRVYLTFPLGAAALSIETGPALAFGVLLYLATGALYGLLFHALLEGLLREAPGVWRLLAASALGLLIWLVNFYLVLSWLQPLVAGGASIPAFVPAWLAALTHLVFAWTVVLMEHFVMPASSPRD